MLNSRLFVWHGVEQHKQSIQKWYAIKIDLLVVGCEASRQFHYFTIAKIEV